MSGCTLSGQSSVRHAQHHYLDVSSTDGIDPVTLAGIEASNRATQEQADAMTRAATQSAVDAANAAAAQASADAAQAAANAAQAAAITGM